MKTGLFSIIVPLVLIVFTACEQSSTDEKQEENKTTKNDYLIASTAWYQTSAELEACYYQAFNQAKQALLMQIKADSTEKPNAVVMDIDETLLDNSPFQVKMIETGKAYNKDFWKKWTSKAEAKALPGAIDFLEFVKENEAEIIYISNRMVDELDPTVKNMKELGFPETRKDHFYLKKETSDKTIRRNKVRDNYDILLFVGDNLTDYKEFFDQRDNNYGKNNVSKHKDIFGNKFIILPNPMYGGWFNALLKQAESDTLSTEDMILNQLKSW